MVAAQWDVEDDATAVLMADLYSRLADGTGVAAALAETQAARHRAGVHPLEWAGFVTLGGPGLLGAPRRSRAGRKGDPDVATGLNLFPKSQFAMKQTSLGTLNPEIRRIPA